LSSCFCCAYIFTLTNSNFTGRINEISVLNVLGKEVYLSNSALNGRLNTFTNNVGILTRTKARSRIAAFGQPSQLFNFNTGDEGGNSYHSNDTYSSSTGITTITTTNYKNEEIKRK
jgi:hypothetical protein